ncbi:hypothetical protein ACYZT3_28160 [Pseudomonas sp. MDT1-16]
MAKTTMKKRQLFLTIKDVSVPSRIILDRNTGELYVKNESYHNLVITYWPNGRPCLLINQWLLSRSHTWTGSTAETYASLTSHLTNYCFDQNLQFHELNDLELHRLKKALIEEKNGFRGRKPRKNNQVRRILKASIAFLVWYQKTFLSRSSTALIGTKDKCPQVIIEYRKNRHDGRRYIFHPSYPPKDSKEKTKKPIPDYAVSAVETTISAKALEAGIILDDLPSQVTVRSSIAGYMYQRRMFMVWIFKKAGLRPSELINYPLEKNQDFMKTKKIILPTKKTRRKGDDITREFKLTTSECSRFNRYLRARDTFITMCEMRFSSYIQPKALMLTSTGAPLMQGSMAKDFKRLVNTAGLVDVRGCLSTFRHRFITREVVSYLNEILADAPKRSLITDAVFQSILKRVSIKTGHINADSLWDYIDLACEEIEMFSAAEVTIAKSAEMDEIREEMNELIHFTKQLELKLAPPLREKLIEHTEALRRSNFWNPSKRMKR